MIGALAVAPSARAAESDACGAVVQALHALGEAERYHWTMSATSPARRRPMEREQIVIGDRVYLTPDEGRWMQQRMPRSERAARMADEIAHAPPADCRAEGMETRDGTPMLVFAYRQGGGDKRLWIGAADGLPRFFKSSEGPVSVSMRVDYAEVAAPLP